MERPLPVLVGRRVLLREPEETDAEALFQHASDPEVTRFLAFDPPSTIDETLHFIVRCHEHRRQDHEHLFVIADVARDVALGITGLRHIDRELSTAQIGTWLARSWWGSGVNEEAKELILDYAFTTLKLHRIEARIVEGNDRSERAFERLGATCEGRLRESFAKHGEFLDSHLYAILAGEWQSRRRPRSARADDRPGA
ncbi:MAG: GNAT family N-acetyltransferase [Acidobacteria bacterium]|nr:GNAT family N-acetyltransferase [Acidobacteriota bacterium]